MSLTRRIPRLIATMLGRLKMDIDQCIRCFEVYAADILEHPRFLATLMFGIRNRPKYSISNVENALIKVVKTYGMDGGGPTWAKKLFAAPYDHCRT